jgi:hypothetical protein
LKLAMPHMEGTHEIAGLHLWAFARAAAEPRAAWDDNERLTLARMLAHGAVAATLIIVSLVMNGRLRVYEQLSWTDAFLNAAMLLNEVEIRALEADRGRYRGYVRVVGRRNSQATLDEPIVSLPEHYERKPLLRGEEE